MRNLNSIDKLENLDEVKIALTFYLIPVLSQLNLERQEKAFRELFKGIPMELTHSGDYDLREGIMNNIVKAITVCNKVLENAYVEYQSKVSPKFGNPGSTSFNDRYVNRPERGGYGILDVYLKVGHSNGYFDGSSFDDIFSMYLTYVLINYEDESIVNNLVRYTHGYLSADKIII